MNMVTTQPDTFSCVTVMNELKNVLRETNEMALRHAQRGESELFEQARTLGMNMAIFGYNASLLTQLELARCDSGLGFVEDLDKHVNWGEG